MTARSLNFVVDTQRLKPTRGLGRAARAGTTVGLTHRMLRDLEQELGGYKRAVKWLVKLATETNRPITVNLPTGPDTSTTVAIAPKGWSDERLRGFVGGIHQELEEQFGPASIRQWGNDCCCGRRGQPTSAVRSAGWSTERVSSSGQVAQMLSASSASFAALPAATPPQPGRSCRSRSQSSSGRVRADGEDVPPLSVVRQCPIGLGVPAGWG